MLLNTKSQFDILFKYSILKGNAIYQDTKKDYIHIEALISFCLLGLSSSH